MSTEITEKPREDDGDEHKLNRKEIIHLGFQNKTKGEAAFNIASYIGVGYIGVTAFSVFTTWLMNDKFPGIGKFIENTAAKVGISKTIATIVTLFAGGTIASVLPVKALEDHKVPIVKALDRMLYTDEEIKDPKIQKAHKELDAMPKQTWLSVFSSRVVAFAATFGVFFLIGSNKGPMKNLPGKSLDNISTLAGRGLDGFFNKSARAEIGRIAQHNEAEIAAGRMTEHVIMRDGVHKDRMPSRIFQYITIDAIYTLITSATLFISTRLFGAVIGQVNPDLAAMATGKKVKKAESVTPAPAEANEPAPQLTHAPPTKVTSPVRLERVAEPQHGTELTA